MRVPCPNMIANYAITYRCNSKCMTCGIWKINPSPDDELKIGEIKEFFEANKILLKNVRMIQLTGGEPFLKQELPEIVAAIIDNLPRCYIWIATNGFQPDLIECKTKAILKGSQARLGITVSIDGDENTHDLQRGLYRSYKRAYETLSRLTHLRGDHPNLDISIGMTLTPLNQEEIKNVLKISESFNTSFTIRPANFSPAYYRNNPITSEWNHNSLHSGLMKLAKYNIKRLGFLKAVPILTYLYGMEAWIKGERRKNIRCTAGSSSFFLDPTGSVFPCIFIDKPLGNIRSSSFEKLWVSNPAENLRKEIRDKRCPGCWVECEKFRDIKRDWMALTKTVIRTLTNPNYLDVNLFS